MKSRGTIGGCVLFIFRTLQSNNAFCYSLYDGPMSLNGAALYTHGTYVHFVGLIGFHSICESHCYFYSSSSTLVLRTSSPFETVRLKLKS